MDMECIAHRGFAGVNPENTLVAVEAALEADADAIELDVRRCADELVVVHDETVDRVTDASGPVSAFTAAELAGLSVYGTDTGIPRLVDVCDAVSPDVRLNLEMKERDTAAEAVETAREHGCDLLVSSFLPGELAAIPDVPRAFLFEDDPERGIERARDLGCRAVHPHWRLCTRSFLADAHGAGLAVNPWTIDSHEIATRLADLGVDGLIADAPAYCDADGPHGF